MTACSPGVSEIADQLPQSQPRQFGVATWLYIVPEYAANGQPLEKSLPDAQRPNVVKLKLLIVTVALRQSLNIWSGASMTF